MKKQIILLITLLILLPLVSAELPQSVERGSCVNIKIPLNASWVNISTITYPNQTMISLNVGASFFGGTFFYDDFCNTDQIGTYTYEFFASDGFTSGNSFRVTESGDDNSTPQSLLFIILLIINILFLILFIILSIKIPYGNKMEMTKRGPAITGISILKYFKLISIWISYALFLWLITLIAGIVNNYISFDPLKDMAMNLYFYFSAFGFVVNLTMTVFIFVIIWKDIILNKKLLNEGLLLLRDLKK